MDLLEYKGYLGTVEYSKADKSLIGKVLGMEKETILYEGNSLNELRSDFETAIDSYLEFCQLEGITPSKPFNGEVILKMTPTLHASASIAAVSEGITLNEILNRAIVHGLDDLAIAQ